MINKCLEYYFLKYYIVCNEIIILYFNIIIFYFDFHYIHI